MSASPTWAEIFRRILFNVRAWRTWRRGDIATSCGTCGTLLSASEAILLRCDDCAFSARRANADAAFRLSVAGAEAVLRQAAMNAAMQNAARQHSALENAAMQNMTADQQRAAQLGGMFGASLGDLSGMLFNRRPH